MNLSNSNADSLSKSRSDGPSGLVLEHIPGTFGMARLRPDARIPNNVHRSVFSSVSRSSEELSIVCEDKLVPEDVQCERGWSAIKVAGTLDFSLIGVLASLAQPLADARIGLFTVSTYDTDYLMVREKVLDKAVAVLEAAGHTFDTGLLTDKELDGSSKEASTGEPGLRDQEAPKSEEPVSGLLKPEASVAEPKEPEPKEPEPKEPEPSKLSPTSTDRPQPGHPEADSKAETGQPARKRQSAFERVLSEYGRPTSRRGQDKARDSDESGSTPELGGESPASVESAAGETPTTSAALVDTDAAAVASEAATDAAVEAPSVSDVEHPSKESEAEGLFTGAIPQNPVEITDRSFADLGLSAPILATVREVGFQHPTPIQAAVIPEALTGKDVVGLAETGSGKTAAFCLPLAERLTHGRGTRGLILCPTREIALQTKAFLDIFGRDHELETVAVIGGVKMGPQIDGFRRDADILVATPGRLADHMRRGNVRLDKIEELVLDEADHMLDLGFLPQIKEILEQVPDERRTLMFSATMPPPIERLAQLFMRNPVRHDIRPVGQIAAGIEHRLYLIKDEDRKKCLFALLRAIEGSTLVFVRRKLYTEWLARQIELAGFRVARIHSDRSQSQRVEALRAFREGKVRILVATDVAARGIDVPLIQHVINYGLPEQSEDYVHRAGRTARGSAAGVVSTIGTWQDKLSVREIELDLGITMPRCSVDGVEAYVELPKRKQVRRRRLL